VSKSKEELLRDEVHFFADLNQKYNQWALTVMVSLDTAIFFVRHELVQTYVDAGLLKKGDELFLRRYLIGTAFLFVGAYVFHRFSRRAAEQYRYYKTQLVASSESGIQDTGDIDFAVPLDLNEFAELERRLQVDGWIQFANREHRWRSVHGTINLW